MHYAILIRVVLGLLISIICATLLERYLKMSIEVIAYFTIFYFFGRFHFGFRSLMQREFDRKDTPFQRKRNER